jgi:hypothetical protein
VKCASSEILLKLVFCKKKKKKKKPLVAYPKLFSSLLLIFTLEYERCAQRCRIAMMKTFQVNVNGDVQSVKDIKKIGVRIQPIFQNRR